MHRSTTIDLCRALLFILMMNTHALTIAGVGDGHWLRADCWLPNGWATMAFVVLSGFGVGYIYAGRPADAARDRAVRGRAAEILLVMFGSNVFFAALRQVKDGGAAAIASLDWWTGFVTLNTPWTISGVLLPTALVLLTFPVLYKCIKQSPWLSLAGLLAARLAVDLVVRELGAAAGSASWPVRLFLIEGLGGFPVLPFLINGCLGIWLGMARHRSEPVWQVSMGLLLLLQLALYFGNTYFRDALRPFGFGYLMAFGALGKFAWMFLMAYVVSLVGGRFLTGMLALIGQYALGSFVMHRVFLQGLAIALGAAGLGELPVELRYTILAIGTLFLTWALCVSRLHLRWIDASLRKVAL